MKRFQFLLVALLLLINLVVATPAWADRVKLDNNPDYIELTQALDNLLKARDTQATPEGMTEEEVQQKIDQLQFQKYIMETGKKVGECLNETGKTLAVYGAKPKASDSTYDSVIYLLPDGQATNDDWNCQGLYLPNDVKVAGIDSGTETAVAIKILPGTQLVAKTNPETGSIELNLPPAKVLKAGEINWEIPELTQADLDTQFPAAPLED
jgi:hypothetical protein